MTRAPVLAQSGHHDPLNQCPLLAPSGHHDPFNQCPLLTQTGNRAAGIAVVHNGSRRMC